MTRRGPGEGSVYPRGDGRWEGAVHLGYEDGRRVRKWVIGHSRREVADKLEALLRAKREERPIPDGRTKLGPFLHPWFDEVARPTLRASTYSSYDDILRLHLIPGLGRIPLAKLGPADVLNRPDFDGDSKSWRNMESWQTRTAAAPGERARGSIHPN
jgi:integrase